LPKYNRRWREYADLLDFEKTTSEEITRRLTANEQMLRNADSSRGQGSSGSGGSGGSSDSHRNTGKKSAEHRVGSSSQRLFKAKKPAAKLSRATLKSLEDMVKRGGGEKVGQDVETSAEWCKLTKEKDLCYKCDVKGHFGRDYRVSRTFRGGEALSSADAAERLNAIFPGMSLDDESIESDYNYLYSLENPRALFQCSVRPRSTITGDMILDEGVSIHIQSTETIALIDSGAGPVYTSQKLALKNGYKINTDLNGKLKSARLPNGVLMKPIGYIEYEMQMDQYRGIERSLVLDFDADFDIILGLYWCTKWNVVLDFANISFTVEIKADTLKITQNFVPTEIQGFEDVDKDALNLIDLKELESLLKKGAETMLFFAKEGHEIDDLNAVSEAGPVDALQVSAQDPEMQKVLLDYPDVFRETLSDGLPPQHSIDHGTDTDQEKPINRSVYPLSVV
jgi:hypothetical protein